MEGQDYITFKLKNKQFPISISLWLYPSILTVANGVLDIGNMHIALNGSAVVAINELPGGLGKPNLVCLYMERVLVNGVYTFTQNYYTTAGHKNTGGVTLTSSAWNHICWVADTSASWRLFINGTKYSINASAYPIMLGDDNHISNVGMGRRNWFRGHMDNFYLYNNYALTDDEVNALYNI